MASDKGSVALNGINFPGQPGLRSSDVSRPGAHFQHFIGAIQLQHGKHGRDYVGLRNSLSFADGQRVIFVRLLTIRLGDKFVSRSMQHKLSTRASVIPRQRSWESTIRDGASRSFMFCRRFIFCGSAFADRS